MSEEIRKQGAELNDEVLEGVGGGAIDLNAKKKTDELRETSAEVRSKAGKSVLSSILEDDGATHFT